LPQVSPAPQVPSPQSAQKPQSGVQFSQLSSLPQLPLPHATLVKSPPPNDGSVRPQAPKLMAASARAHTSKQARTK
jgi:hypothetical protein